MKHYVVSYYVDYEDTTIIGIYDTLEKAQESFNQQVKELFNEEFICTDEIYLDEWENENVNNILCKNYKEFCKNT